MVIVMLKLLLILGSCWASLPFFSLDNCLPSGDNQINQNGNLESKVRLNDVLHPDETMQPPVLRVMILSLVPVIKAQWNASGHVVNLTGLSPYILDLIAQSAKLKYCWMPLGREYSLDDTPAEKKGLISRLADGDADLIIAGMIRTVPRSRYVDFTMPIIEAAYSIMIPFPEENYNTSALSQPFQPFVWIGLLIAGIVVTLSLYTFKAILKYLFTQKSNSAVIVTRKRHLIYAPNRLSDSITYVLTVLLSQGNYCASSKSPIRLVAGAWCLAACVLIPAYSGTLLSFVVTLDVKPLVSSIYDIHRVPGLKVAVDTWKAADTRLQIAAQDKTSAFGSAAAKIQRTIFHCNASSQCINKVLTGNYVYIHGEPAIDQMIIDDLVNTGKCRFSKAKESFFRGFLHWALPKNSPYSEKLNKGMLQLEASGLSQFWRRRNMKTADKCLRPIAGEKKNLPSTRLTMSQLSSTFVLLGCGCALGFLAFLAEVFSMHRIIRTFF